MHRGWSLDPRCTFLFLEPRCTFWKVHRGPRNGVAARKVHRGCGLVSVFLESAYGVAIAKGSLAPWTPVHFLKVHTGSGFCRKVHRGCRAPCESAPGAGGSASKTGKGKSAPGFEVEKVHRGWSLLPRCTFRYLEPRCTFPKVHRGKGSRKNNWDL